MADAEGSDMALETEIEVFESRKSEFEERYPQKFVVIKGREFIGAFDTFENAAADAVLRFGRGPYLIRQVGVPPPELPISWIYRAA